MQMILTYEKLKTNNRRVEKVTNSRKKKDVERANMSQRFERSGQSTNVRGE